MADTIDIPTDPAHWWNKPCCFNCTYWAKQARIDMVKTLVLWVKEGYDLNVLDGVAEEGACAEGPPGLNLDIHGDAYVDLTIDANFCCPTFASR